MSSHPINKTPDHPDDLIEGHMYMFIVKDKDMLVEQTGIFRQMLRIGRDLNLLVDSDNPDVKYTPWKSITKIKHLSS